MAGVAVVTDSTASLSQEQVARAGVTIIPLQVVIDEVSRPESADAISAAVVAEAIRTRRRVTTSRPSPEAFSAAYADLAAAGASAIVSIHLSRAMSATVEAATKASQTAPVPVTVVDSTTVAMACGFAVLSAAGVAADGAAADQVAEQARRRATAATTYFYVDTLEHLRRGGRIGPAAALLGSALSVKPLLTVAKGIIRPHERVRTAAKALLRLEDLGVTAYLKAGKTCKKVDVAVHHLDNHTAAGRLAEQLSARLTPPASVTITEVSAVLGAHVGPGVLGIVISPQV